VAENYKLNMADDLQNEEIEETKAPSELEEALAKAQENLAGWQRAQADYQNLQKDSAVKLAEALNFGQSVLLLKLLPALDNLNVGLEHLPEEQKETPWAKGLVQVAKQFDEILTAAGLEKMPNVAGQEFNPELHEAVGHEESEEADNIIIKELKAGYRFQGKVIRPALVVVAKNKR